MAEGSKAGAGVHLSLIHICAPRAPTAKDQRAVEMLREIRAKGEALTDRIDRLLTRLA